LLSSEPITVDMNGRTDMCCGYPRLSQAAGAAERRGVQALVHSPWDNLG